MQGCLAPVADRVATQSMQEAAQSNLTRRRGHARNVTPKDNTKQRFVGELCHVLCAKIATGHRHPAEQTLMLPNNSRSEFR